MTSKLAAAIACGLWLAGCANDPSAFDTTRIRPDAEAPVDAGTSAPPVDAAGWGRRDTGAPPAPCTAGTVDACTTTCGTMGSTTCGADGTFGPCVVPAEDCNGADDDCDGTIDEAIPSRACSSACGGGTESCRSGAWTGCTAVTPVAETCDGIDQDCDSRIDEGVTRPCTTACGGGVETCRTGTWLVCSAPEPTTEVCNGIDDDCDGTIDDGLGARVEVTTYGALAGAHPDCDGTSQRFGSACNAAISRYCNAGCTSSGFGPVENFGDSATVTCTTINRRVVQYATLAAHQPTCNGTTQRVGPDCSAAIHRYCRAEGFVSGYGPLENSGSMADVGCVGDARVELRTPTYAALAAEHAPCNGTTQRWGADCNAAIHRWCREEGFVSGFGPVEQIGSSAQVACVRD